MYRACIHKLTGKLREAQSDARPGTLLANVQASGDNPADFEERDITDNEFQTLLVAANPPPTLDELANRLREEMDTGNDKKLRVIFEVMFDMENRMRVREGKASVTKAQYLDALVNIYKSL